MSCNGFLSKEKWIIKGVPILFLVGSMLHFVYELSDQNIVTALFSPVNESVWEHLKMVVLPIILWWSLYFIIAGKKCDIDKDKWFTSTLIALATALISIPCMYYFYTGAFGVESIAVDIIILFLAILFGQLMALHYYKYGIEISYTLAIFFIIIIVCAFIYFTFNPPHFPIFMDSSTGKYGI